VAETDWALENAYQWLAAAHRMTPLTVDQLTQLVEAGVSVDAFAERLDFLDAVRAVHPEPLSAMELLRLWASRFSGL
jgi:hypothetical protein